MADPLSIAGVAIALAGTGISIAKALNTIVDSARKAEKRIRPVIRDVEVVSGILTQIGTQLENEAIRRLCTKQFFDTAKKALDGCQETFTSLEALQKGLITVDGDLIKMTTTAKFSLYFKQQELDTLQGQMGHSKTSLNLVIGTLQIVIIMRTASKDSTVVEGLKLDLQTQIQIARGASDRTLPSSTFVASTNSPQPDISDSALPPSGIKLSLASLDTSYRSKRGVGREEIPEITRQPQGDTNVDDSNEHHSSRDMGLTPDLEKVKPTFNIMKRTRSRSNDRATAPDSTDHRSDHIRFACACLNESLSVTSDLNSEVHKILRTWRKQGRYNPVDLENAYDEIQKRFYKFWRREQEIGRVVYRERDNQPVWAEPPRRRHDTISSRKGRAPAGPGDLRQRPQRESITSDKAGAAPKTHERVEEGFQQQDAVSPVCPDDESWSTADSRPQRRRIEACDDDYRFLLLDSGISYEGYDAGLDYGADAFGSEPFSYELGGGIRDSFDEGEASADDTVRRRGSGIRPDSERGTGAAPQHLSTVDELLRQWTTLDV